MLLYDAFSYRPMQQIAAHLFLTIVDIRESICRRENTPTPFQSLQPVFWRAWLLESKLSLH
jgi:hypothetical protein